MTTELLAPAGDSDCAFAALHYGADAIYLGLKRFSARAEAGNFTAEALNEVVAYAHSLTPRRSVYVALNTLILDSEQDEVLEALVTVAEARTDAVIVQDLGLARLVRRHFPELRLHASTQLAIHNLEGATAVRELGFSRVTLARELTFPEIAKITANSGLQTETFVHGALCYCYSGLCLYSAVLRGRSGNRGRCAYPCRDVFRSGDGRRGGLVFSMMDLALPDAIQELKRAGVASLKIEGRKKSALYVASTVDFYRRLMDGESLKALEQKGLPADIKTVFSRPWTSLYFQGRRKDGVIDPEFVGHRGARIGCVSGVVQNGGADWVQFLTSRRLERHDGIQIDVAGAEKPFGFAVNRLQVQKKGGGWSGAFQAERQENVLVALPPEHPVVPTGATVYCSSSQAVKQRYAFPCPRPGVFRARRTLDVDVRIGRSGVTLLGRVRGMDGVEAEVVCREKLDACKDAHQVELAVEGVFGKLGNTGYERGNIIVINAERQFVPVSLMNRLRRQLVESLDARVATGRVAMNGTLKATEAVVALRAADEAPLAWLLKTDRLSHLDAWTGDDWSGVSDLIVGIEVDGIDVLERRLADLSAKLSPERVRLAMPLITRDWDRAELARRIRILSDMGYRRWEISSLAGQVLLRENCGTASKGDAMLLTADWPMYVMNRSAIRLLQEERFARLTLSPENSEANVRELLSQYGDRLVLPVYQDTPLFISENCPPLVMAREGSAGRFGNSSDDEYVSRANEKVTLLHRGGRTVVIHREPLCLAGRINALRRQGLRMVRADFVWRQYEAEESVAIWRRLRSGGTVKGIEGCFGAGTVTGMNVMGPA